MSPVKALVVKASTVSCGTDFTVWLCSGTVFSAGSGQFGQLGDGSDHSYNAKDCEFGWEGCEFERGSKVLGTGTQKACVT